MKNNKKQKTFLTKGQIRERGWASYQIAELLPKPTYVAGVPYWLLSDVEAVEASFAFYAETE